MSTLGQGVLLGSDAGVPGPAPVLSIVRDDITYVAPELEVHDAAGPLVSAVVELERREHTYRRCLALADAAATMLAVSFSAMTFGRHLHWMVLLAAPFAILIAKTQGLYDRDDQVITKTNLSEWRTVLQSMTVTSIGLYLTWRLLTDAQRGGGMRLFLFMVICGFILDASFRNVARLGARRLSPAERCAVIGAPDATVGLVQRLRAAPGVELVGILPDEDLSGSVAELRSVVEHLGLHRLVIAPTQESQSQTLHLIQAAKFLGVRVSLVPSVMTAVGGFAAMEELDGMTLLGVPRFGLTQSSMALKRSFDVVVGGAALVLLSPLLLVIAALIRLDSEGPVLFRQTRIGRGGRPFKILKFRSMVNGADAMKQALLTQNEATGGLFKIAEDPRITRIGRLIRSTHLDELPQLLNVLTGEMSLVGPRPLVADEDVLVVGRDRHRVNLVPGITGPWQLKGPLATPLSEMAMLDYRYASAWSIWTDLDILIRTVLRVLDRGGH